VPLSKPFHQKFLPNSVWPPLVGAGGEGEKKSTFVAAIKNIKEVTSWEPRVFRNAKLNIICGHSLHMTFR
jgi:hypothetical protein